MGYNWYAFKIVIICTIFFLLQAFVSTFDAIEEQMVLVSSEAISKPWMFITHMFLHGSFEHLFFNMFALAMFGSILEKIIGAKRFLSIYFFSGIVAGLGSFLFYEASLGASGAIMGIMGTLAVLRPNMRVYISYIPMPMSLAVVVWALGDLLGFFVPIDNVAHIAHLAGLAAGLIYGIFLRGKQKTKSYQRDVHYREINENEFRKWEKSWM